jgi:hypothetical protein
MCGYIFTFTCTVYEFKILFLLVLFHDGGRGSGNVAARVIDVSFEWV